MAINNNALAVPPVVNNLHEGVHTQELDNLINALVNNVLDNDENPSKKQRQD